MAQFTFLPLGQRQPQFSMGDALQSLAQNYVQKRIMHSEQNKVAQGLQGLGFSPDEARSFSSLPEPLLQTLLKSLSERGYGGGLGAVQSLASPQMNTGIPQQQQQGVEQLTMGQAPIGISESSTATPRSIRDVLSQPTLREQRENKKIALKERQVLNEEKNRAFKDTSAFRTEVLKEKHSAENVLDDLNRMKELETGDAAVDTAGYTEFLNRAGLDIPALMRPESEEFNKLRQSQLRDARQYFGGRVTNFEMDQFLKSIPSLNQSPEGRKRVIANMERINKLKVETANEMRKVIKENGGIPPLDLQEKVDERMGPKREKIAKQFREDLKRKVPEAQNPYVTATQAILGSVVGAPGKLIGKIGSIGASFL